jgi:uncharacterized glyoxalase superfamily protein PhnB
VLQFDSGYGSGYIESFLERTIAEGAGSADSQTGITGVHYFGNSSRQGGDWMSIKPDMVGMVVKDMEAALRFYRELGLEIPEGQEAEPYVEVITPNGYRISWNSVEMVKGIDPDWVEPVGQRISLAFKCDSPAEVDATYRKLTGAGYKGHKEPWDAFWGQRYAQVVDPDGNIVDLFAPLTL